MSQSEDGDDVAVDAGGLPHLVQGVEEVPDPQRPQSALRRLQGHVLDAGAYRQHVDHLPVRHSRVPPHLGHAGIRFPVLVADHDEHGGLGHRPHGDERGPVILDVDVWVVRLRQPAFDAGGHGGDHAVLHRAVHDMDPPWLPVLGRRGDQACRYYGIHIFLRNRMREEPPVAAPVAYVLRSHGRRRVEAVHDGKKDAGRGPA